MLRKFGNDEKCLVCKDGGGIAQGVSAASARIQIEYCWDGNEEKDKALLQKLNNEHCDEQCQVFPVNVNILLRAVYCSRSASSASWLVGGS